MTTTTSAASEPISKARALSHSVHGRWTFAREFVRAPKVVAAFAPSSKRLARMMVDGLDFAHARAVVEYGPGLGTFSKAILARIAESAPTHAVNASDHATPDANSGCRFIAIERNQRMAELFRQRFPQVKLFHDDAANVKDICRQEGLDKVDYVISGLGWPSFSDDVRLSILRATADILRPGGEFRTFGYHVGLLMRGAWHFRRTVRSLFREVTISKVVWTNAPPAFVYRCIR